MYYYLEKDTKIIVGQGSEEHPRYFSVLASVIDNLGADNPMGYKFENGSLSKSAEMLKSERDQERTRKLANLEIEIGSKTFPADEAAQTRMMIALKSAEISGVQSVKFPTVSGELVDVSAQELKQMIILCAQKLNEILGGAK